MQLWRGLSSPEIARRDRAPRGGARVLVAGTVLSGTGWSARSAGARSRTRAQPGCRGAGRVRRSGVRHRVMGVCRALARPPHSTRLETRTKESSKLASRGGFDPFGRNESEGRLWPAPRGEIPARSVWMAGRIADLFRPALSGGAESERAC